MVVTITAIMETAKRNYRNCHDLKMYEYFKDQIKKFYLTPERYQQLIKELAEILGV